MIANELQYRITQAQLQKLREALLSFDFDDAARQTGSRVLAQAEYEALESQAEELAAQTAEYEALKSGAIRILEAERLSELPVILIKARIARGLTQGQLAERLGLKEQQIQRYEAGQYASASLWRLSEVAEALGLEVSEVAELGRTALEPGLEAQTDDLDWSRFPVQEMYRRNWFEAFFRGSLADAKDSAEELAKAFVGRAIARPVPALLRSHVRSGSTMDRYALLAWQCRVLTLARQRDPSSTFSRRALGKEWLKGLVHLSRCNDGPQQAKAHLEAAGIRFVIEPHLRHTYLDGAALLLPHGAPVVAMTLRYDRLDNFWFVLTHEVIHMVEHLRRGRAEHFFDDLDGPPDEIEKAADRLAAEALVPADRWEVALARYVQSEEAVRELADELQISPAIIAGKIRREAENYTILRDLVGYGAVRKQFPEVRFGE